MAETRCMVHGPSIKMNLVSFVTDLNLGSTHSLDILRKS